MLNTTFEEMIVAKKSVCQTLPLTNIFILANVFLGVGMLHGFTGIFSRKEGGIQVLEGLAPSTQTVGSLLRTPWLTKPDRKIAPKVLIRNFQLKRICHLQV
jgi:hypothetical protein